jgi:hypothetical protein
VIYDIATVESVAERRSDPDDEHKRMIARLRQWRNQLHTVLLSLQPDAGEVSPPFDFAAHLQRQRVFSERTFGPGVRTHGVIDHIRKELWEIESDPTDASEWADVVILALDGFWRAGYSPEQIIAALVAKQTKNEGRTWPDWRTQPTDRAIEHDRSGEAHGEASPPEPSHVANLGDVMAECGLADGATISTVQRKLRVDAANAMRLLALRDAIWSCGLGRSTPCGEASPPTDSPLRVALLAARDALAAFGKQAGWVPQQHGYSATMTEAEMQLARAVADINTILAQTHGAGEASPVVPSGWQPIESAPNDGSAFRAYGPELIHPDFNPWGSVEACFDGETLIGAVWNGTHDIWNTMQIKATHWMPLPAPPSSGATTTESTENS